MDEENIKLSEEDFNLDFLTDSEPRESYYNNNYKLLIVDDEMEVHTTTKFILKDFVFEGHKLEFIDAYSCEEAIAAITMHKDIAVIILDVVMEENQSGLKYVDYVRNTLNNVFVRILLRTGEPGQAPENRIIVDYDINDYLLKTDITIQRLFTSLYQALRSFRDLTSIDNNRKGLEKIIESSSKMFLQGSVQEFFNCILDEMLGFRTDLGSVCFRIREKDSGFAYFGNGKDGVIISATGDYRKYIGKEISSIAELEEIYNHAKEMDHVEATEVKSLDRGFLVWKKSTNNVSSFIYIDNHIKAYDLELIKVYLSNYSLALDNYIISQQIIGTQVEIINSLGDVIESRSHEEGYHVKRVSEFAFLIGKKLGLTQAECMNLKIASMVHDAGKIGINDNILLKPGRLTEEEFEIIKTHTQIGNNLFKKSELEVLKKAAEICLYHHEKYDGSGYPRRLKGEEIPLQARIVAVVDVFDAISHKRCYKEAWDLMDSKEYIRKQRGTSFDPVIVDIFMENFDEIVKLMKKYKDE